MKSTDTMIAEIRDRQNQRRIKREENDAINERLKRGETVQVTFGGPTMVSAEDDLDLLLALLDRQ